MEELDVYAAWIQFILEKNSFFFFLNSGNSFSNFGLDYWCIHMITSAVWDNNVIKRKRKKKLKKTQVGALAWALPAAVLLFCLFLHHVEKAEDEKMH